MIQRAGTSWARRGKLLGWLAVAWLAAGPNGPAAAGAQPPAAMPARLGLMEAILLTLERDPNIQLQERQVDIARGILESAGGQFDPTLDTAFSIGRLNTPLSETDRILDSPSSDLATLVEDVASYRLGLSKQLRSGPTFSSGVELSRVADNRDHEVAANLARVSFAVKVPLLRGAGTKAVDATERAARVQRSGTELALQHVIATRLLNTVNAYWDCLAAELNLRVLVQSETNAWQLTNHLGQLIKAGEFPAVELQQAGADYAEKTAARIAAEQELFAARQNLGLALGLDAEQVAEAPLPAEDFPGVPAATTVPRVADGPLTAQSLARRGDYQSALKAEVASEILLVAARNGTKPQLDLGLEAGYTGLDEGSSFHDFFGSLDPWAAPGPNLLASLRLVLPIGNHAARGLLLQRDSEHQQSLIRARDLARNIGSAIQVAINDLRGAMEEAAKLRQSVELYENAVANESVKLKLGSSTVLDQITIANRFASTLLRHTAARARYANALARVRYETGLLVPLDAKAGVTLRREDLLTVPDLAAAPPPAPSP